MAQLNLEEDAVSGVPMPTTTIVSPAHVIEPGSTNRSIAMRDEYPSMLQWHDEERESSLQPDVEDLDAENRVLIRILHQ